MRPSSLCPSLIAVDATEFYCIADAKLTFDKHPVVAPGLALLVGLTNDQRRNPLPRRVVQNEKRPQDLKRREGAVEIVDQVAHVLQPDGQAQQAVANPHFGTRFG